MSFTSKASVALVVVALSGTFASSAAANRKVEKATTVGSFSVKGSNGYWIDVTADRVAGEKNAKVTVTAERQRYKVEAVRVAYSVDAQMSRHGGFDAKLPGLGRIHVSFDQAKARTTKTPPARPAAAPRKRSTTVPSGGRFRSAPKAASPWSTARPRRARSRNTRGGSAGKSKAGGYRKGKVGRRTSSSWLPGRPPPRARQEVTFSTSGYPESEPPTTSGGIPTVAFTAGYSTEKRGIQIAADAYRSAVSSYFHVPGSIGTLTDATVTPPAPFAGAGTYQAESPTTAAWTGDLSIRFPGAIGIVPLTGPGFTARLCESPTACSGPP